jgi:predicted acylesterase/phospholipase RssA
MKLGKPHVGICLSGGGAFGAFQAGVLQSLKRYIHISAYAGSSIGAINAILSSSRDSSILPQFWLNIPECIRREMEFAQKQWIACLVSLSRAGRIGGEAGRNHYANMSPLQIGRKWLLSKFGFQDIESECKEVGESAARDYINPIIKTIEDKGPLISEKAANYLRGTLTGVNPTRPVYATVSELKQFSAQHILKMKKQKHCEITNLGSYRTINSGNASDIGLASAALPLVFGRRNNVNSTEFLDGGLCDNLPAAALSDHVDAGEIDCLLLIDVSRNSAAVRSEMIGHRIKRCTPVLYIGLAETSDRMRKLLDFKMADTLFRKGERAGVNAVKRWFTGGFDPVSSYLDSPALLPESHILRVT